MPSRIAVLGLGYVGCVSAACLARLGYDVIGIDRDEHKVRTVNSGHAPFFEPGLDEIVSQTAASGKLRATASLGEVIDEADLAFICVGTPSERNGNLGTDQLRRVSDEIASHIRGRTKPLIVAVRSTVFPGTCDEVVARSFVGIGAVKIAANPEFLREGAAVRDFVEPSLIVVGSEDGAAAQKVAELYAPLGVEPCLVSLRAAEIIKYACNSFHAVKIAFANEFGALCSSLEIDGEEVMRTLCEDTKLNISPAYLKPGFAFGGSCLPKDLRALTYRAGRLDLRLPLLEATLPSNQEQLRRAIEKVLDLGPRRLGVIGLAFKENTDDLRESAVVALLEQLIGKGREIRIFDPHIQLDAIYGSNRNFILQQIPHIGRLLDRKLEDTLAWAEHVVIAQKPSPELAQAIEATGLPVTNLVSGK
ncbi:MAG: nucleotide sugar dehydrogenase [Bryobacteraceae bacterium]